MKPAFEGGITLKDDRVWENDVPKHKKKKKSSVSMANIKSNHKHEYVDCMLMDKKLYLKAQYCTLCGKISGRQFFSIFSNEDNGDIETIEVEDVFYDKYVPINL